MLAELCTRTCQPQSWPTSGRKLIAKVHFPAPSAIFFVFRVRSRRIEQHNDNKFKAVAFLGRPPLSLRAARSSRKRRVQAYRTACRFRHLRTTEGLLLAVAEGAGCCPLLRWREDGHNVFSR